MSFWDDIGREIQTLIAQAKLPPANTKRLTKAIRDLETLIPTEGKEQFIMSTPTGMVQIAQADLDAFAAAFETVKAALATYIATLLANQATPLSAADETGLNQALADLTGLEPPAPTPTP
jgi:hypothetical protein